ncbi:MAG: IS200/IS605 family transposase [Acidobacteria bacterium]|nr:IS200/IS605 family transposase [Acidobacteriota bacterium]
MSQSLVKILVHVVFSTKDRKNLIAARLEDELYRVLHGLFEKHNAKLITANGTADHIHLLISIGKNDVSVLIGAIKRATSTWMKSKGVLDFYWQRGYGAFSVSQSNVDAVIRYIGRQKERHANQDFKDEFRNLCARYEVPIDERYCWD